MQTMQKIAIPNDNGNVSAHFGHCKAFILFEVDDHHHIVSQQAIPNPPKHRPGFLPQFLAQFGTNVILTGGMGPRAIGLFEEQKIAVVLGVTGKIETVLSAYLKGDLQGGESLCNHDTASHTCQHPAHDRDLTIAITATGDTLTSTVDSRFGRAPYFILWNTKSKAATVLVNKNADAGNGAGIQSAQMMIDHKVDVILTGMVGPKASTVLNTAAIQICSDTTGTVQAALDRYLEHD